LNLKRALILKIKDSILLPLIKSQSIILLTFDCDWSIPTTTIIYDYIYAIVERPLHADDDRGIARRHFIVYNRL